MTNRSSLPAATLGKQTLHGVLIAELDHPDGIVRVHSGTTDITIGGITYTGAGSLLLVDGINDASTAEGPHTWRMSLARSAPMLTSYAISSDMRDRGIRLLASVSEDGKSWSTPAVIKTGRVSTVTITPEGITAECVTAAVELSRVRQRHTLWTDDQQREFVNANDASFRNVEGVLEVEVPWP